MKGGSRISGSDPPKIEEKIIMKKSMTSMDSIDVNVDRNEGSGGMKNVL